MHCFKNRFLKNLKMLIKKEAVWWQFVQMITSLTSAVIEGSALQCQSPWAVSASWNLHVWPASIATKWKMGAFQNNHKTFKTRNNALVTRIIKLQSNNADYIHLNTWIRSKSLCLSTQYHVHGGMARLKVCKNCGRWGLELSKEPSMHRVYKTVLTLFLT